MIKSLLSGLIALLPIVFNLLTLLIILSVVISWVNADPYNPLVQLVRRLTEPMFRPFRKLTKGITGPFDLAPLIVLLILVFLQNVLYSYFKFLYHSL